MTKEREKEIRYAIADMRMRKKKFKLIGEPEYTAAGTVRITFQPLGISMDSFTKWWDHIGRPLFVGSVYREGRGRAWEAEWK